jgi:subtilisin family serine protease
MQRLKNFAISSLIFTLLVFPLTTSSHNQESSSRFSALSTSRTVGPQGPRARFVKAEKPIPNRYIVVLDDDVVSDDASLTDRRAGVAAIANSHAKAHRGTVDFIYETALKGYAIELPNEAAARAISNSALVRWVEEDGYGEWDQAPVTPQPSPPWGLDAIDGQMPLPAPSFPSGRTNGFYGFSANGTGVSAYVLDSGINTAHTEFMTPFVSRASIAADCFNWVNCVSGTLTPFFNQQACATGLPAPGNNDCYGHGTHVAGTLGGNNFGVAKNVTIRSVKVGSTFGPVTSATIAAVNWVTGQHQATPSTPAVANMSLQIATGQGLESAVQNSINQGVTIVAAAGNNNADASTASAPQNVADVLSIGSVDWNGVRASSSNWGPGVDLFAPGVQIISSTSGGGICFASGGNSASCLLSGTSHASPHVAGAVAMFLQGRPGQVNCNANPIQGVAPAGGNVSACPDRVSRYIIATAKRDALTSSINGTLPSANRFLSTLALPGPANLLDNNSFFVWSQYVDFLNREPDSSGFATWTFNLNQCSPSDWPCLNTWRIHTVRGFIESGEFKANKPALLNPATIQQYNEEYVRQLYLCLLRRPADAGGLATWVGHLNTTGDYSHVVHGFINSHEYRHRFGPHP